MTGLYGSASGGNQTPQCVFGAPALTEAVPGGGQQVVRLKIIGQPICNDSLQQLGQSR